MSSTIRSFEIVVGAFLVSMCLAAPGSSARQCPPEIVIDGNYLYAVDFGWAVTGDDAFFYVSDTNGDGGATGRVLQYDATGATVRTYIRPVLDPETAGYGYALERFFALDGTRRLVVGAPVVTSGAVEKYPAISCYQPDYGALLWTARNSPVNNPNRLGYSLATIPGDPDGDPPTPTYIIAGAPFGANGEGAVLLFDESGAPMATIAGPQTNLWFGASVAYGGYLGPELGYRIVVGAPAFFNNTDRSRVYTYTWVPGAMGGPQLEHVMLGEVNEWYGYSLAYIGYIANPNGDTVNTCVAGVPRSLTTVGGRVAILDLDNGDEMGSIDNQSGVGLDRFGETVAAVGDPTSSLSVPFAVAAKNHARPMPEDSLSRGRVWVFSPSLAPQVISTWGGEGLGIYLGGGELEAINYFRLGLGCTRDLTGDGQPELVIGESGYWPVYSCPAANPGRAHVFTPALSPNIREMEAKIAGAGYSNGRWHWNLEVWGPPMTDVIAYGRPAGNLCLEDRFCVSTYGVWLDLTPVSSESGTTDINGHYLWQVSTNSPTPPWTQVAVKVSATGTALPGTSNVP